MLKNILETDRPQLTVWRMRIACWMPKATNTHSEYVTLIAFLRQPWLHQGTKTLRYTYIACLVYVDSHMHLTHSVDVVINMAVKPLADT